MEKGYQAMADLVKNNYKNYTIIEGMKRYRGKTHAGSHENIAKKQGLDPNTKIQDLTDEELNTLLDSIVKAEGFKEGEYINKQ